MPIRQPISVSFGAFEGAIVGGNIPIPSSFKKAFEVAFEETIVGVSSVPIYHIPCPFAAVLIVIVSLCHCVSIVHER